MDAHPRVTSPRITHPMDAHPREPQVLSAPTPPAPQAPYLARPPQGPPQGRGLSPRQGWWPQSRAGAAPPGAGHPSIVCTPQHHEPHSLHRGYPGTPTQPRHHHGRLVPGQGSVPHTIAPAMQVLPERGVIGGGGTPRAGPPGSATAATSAPVVAGVEGRGVAGLVEAAAVVAEAVAGWHAALVLQQ